MSSILDDFVALLPGLWTSIRVTLFSLAIGLPLGLIFGQLLTVKRWYVRWPIWIIVDVFRGFPALVTLYLVYFGLPRIDVLLSDEISVIIAVSVTCAAYTAEIFKAAILSVPRGQREAITALALGPATGFVRVILPQVWRMIAPPLVSVSILTFQATALAYSIGMRELLGVAYARGISSFQLLSVLLVAGAMFLAVSSILTLAEWYMRTRSFRSRVGGMRRDSTPDGADVGAVEEIVNLDRIDDHKTPSPHLGSR